MNLFSQKIVLSFPDMLTSWNIVNVVNLIAGPQFNIFVDNTTITYQNIPSMKT